MDINMEHQQTEISKRMTKLWNRDQKAFEILLELRNKLPQELYGEKWEDAFAKQPTAVVCIDERVSLGDPEEPEIGIAGTLVLMDDEEFRITLEKLKNAGVNRVTYHEGCGAAALAKNIKNDSREVLEVAKGAAQNVCRSLDLNSEAQCVGYSDEAHIEMAGDPRFHNARAIVVDGTGKFNPALLEFPSHFLLSAFYEPGLSYTAKELEVALSIALGDHGFGKERFAKEPIAVVLVGGQGEYALEELHKNLSKVLENNKEFISVVNLQKSV